MARVRPITNGSARPRMKQSQEPNAAARRVAQPESSTLAAPDRTSRASTGVQAVRRVLAWGRVPAGGSGAAGATRAQRLPAVGGGFTIKGFGDGGMPVLHQGRYDDDSGAYVNVDSAKALGVTLELLHAEPKK